MSAIPQRDMSWNDYVYSRPGDSYWKSNIKPGFTGAKRMGDTKASLRRLYSRSTILELIELVRARGLGQNLGPDDIDQRDKILTVLKAKDERPEFHPFTRLPAELRNKIYKFYFADFAHVVLHAPKQPPLTLASRQVRSEALPLFYSICAFSFNLMTGERWPRRQSRDDYYRSEVKLRIRQDTCVWMQNTEELYLANIRSLFIAIHTNSSWSRRSRPICLIRIDLTQREENGGSSRLDLLSCQDPAPTIPPGQRQRFQAMMNESLKDIVLQPGGRCRLTRDGLFRLRRALEMALIRVRNWRG